jgi:hypothetical protein
MQETPIMKYWRPFSRTSPWNKKIPANPAIDPDSPRMIADLFLTNSYPTQPAGRIGVNVSQWSVPVYTVDEKKVPWSEIHYSYRIKFCHPQHLVRKAPIPPDAVPDPEGDSHLCVVNTSLTHSWDFWGARRIKGKWLVRSAREFDLRGSGVLKPGEGACRAAGFPLIAGLIGYDEIASGRIDHALVFAYGAPKHGVYVYPASNSDGTSTRAGAIPEGARLQLDPKLDLDRLNLKPAAKIIAQALQQYGMFLGDGGGGVGLYAEVFPGKNKWREKLGPFDLLKLPTEKLRVLKLRKHDSTGIPLNWPTDKERKKEPDLLKHYN